MTQISRKRVDAAMSPGIWDLGNKSLYDLCQSHADHKNPGAVVAKVWLIGRSYAAAIERRKEKEKESDNFYVETVLPAIQASEIDQWIKHAKSAQPGTFDGLNGMIDVHFRTTQLFFSISKMGKRSLASKYLHFHVPDLFYIYDSRAAKALSEMSAVIPRASKSAGHGDNEYRKFAEKCQSLSQVLRDEFGVAMTPRQIDNFLLRVNEN